MSHISDQELQTILVERARDAMLLYARHAAVKDRRAPERFTQVYCASELMKANLHVALELNRSQLEASLNCEAIIGADRNKFGIDLVVFDTDDQQRHRIRAFVEFKKDM